MASNEKIQELADKWLKGTITEDERQLLEEWYNQKAKADLRWSLDTDKERLRKRLFQRIMEKIKLEETPVISLHTSKNKSLVRWASAAAAVILLGFGLWFVNTRHQPNKQNYANINFPPARVGAVLQLANGNVIPLDSAQNGQIALQGEAVINKQGGEVSYLPDKKRIKNVPPSFNTIKTSRGNYFRLQLSDGTKVWLNAASSLRYPAVFSGKERVVKLTGEAYFEVAENKEMPFKVKVNNMVVQDLGTHFDINAYKDEPEIKTTLLEGAVKVSHGKESVDLTPGEQAIIHKNNTKIKVDRPDLKKVMAWQHGFFEFDNTALPEIMRQISRWYDVNIQYVGKPTNTKFGGRISKNLKLGDILTLLHANGVDFKLNGKTLLVLTKTSGNSLRDD
ncbi:MAG: FecR family protein [Tannerellaceae bacterium]|nr:FecR family protein [Tannerellaceae bacterium]